LCWRKDRHTGREAEKSAFGLAGTIESLLYQIAIFEWYLVVAERAIQPGH
jgi:hypothetical protein